MPAAHGTERNEEGPPEKASLVVLTRTAEETWELGAALGRVFRQLPASGAVVVLDGPLGAGKTVLVQGLARGLDVSGVVRSPTFTLIHEHRGPVPLHHVDLYRLEPSDLEGLGLEEILDGPGVAAIEWGERAGAVLPSEHLRIEIAFGAGESDRRVRVIATGERYRRVVEALRACVFSR